MKYTKIGAVVANICIYIIIIMLRCATAKTAYPLYRFVQYDVSGKLMENAMKEIDMYIRDFLNVVAGMTGSVLNWVDCIIVR